MANFVQNMNNFWLGISHQLTNDIRCQNLLLMEDGC